MILDEVIKDLGEKIDDKDFEWPSEECMQDHEQLLRWLKELKDLRLGNEVILRRLKHLLKSDFISQFDQVDPNTKEYIRNIREADWKVAYLCDQNKSCNVKCSKNHRCKRTCDISHAKNFRLVANGIYPIMFEEVDEHCIANVSFDREQLREIVDERVIEFIKERSQNEWIPVSERLPDVAKKCIVQLTDGHITIGSYHSIDKWIFQETNISYAYPKETVIAWQPLPEPYKEEEE